MEMQSVKSKSNLFITKLTKLETERKRKAEKNVVNRCIEGLFYFFDEKEKT